MTIAEKLTAIAENVHKVYAAGTGTQGEYDRFWDAYQENGNRTDYARAFAGIGWTDETFDPKYPIATITNAEQMFNMSAMTVIEQDIDFSLIDNINYMFYYNKVLKRIKSLTFKTDTANAVYPFVNCNALSDITIKGNIGFSISFQWCPLSKESLTSVVSALSDDVTDKTLTVKDSAVTAAFTDEDWTALVDSKPNWTITRV